MKPFNWAGHIEHARALVQEAEKRATAAASRQRSAGGGSLPMISFTIETATDDQLLSVIGWSLQKTIDQVAADALAKMPNATVEAAS